MPAHPAKCSLTHPSLGAKTSALPAKSHLAMALLIALVSLPTGQGAQAATLEGGQPISEALQQHAADSGWRVNWELGEDYYLEQGLPVPGDSVLSDVGHALNTFRAMGGFTDVGAIKTGTKTIVVRRTEAAHGQSEFDPAAARLATMRMKARSHNEVVLGNASSWKHFDSRTASLASTPSQAQPNAATLAPLGASIATMPSALPRVVGDDTQHAPKKMVEPQPLSLERPAEEMSIARTQNIARKVASTQAPVAGTRPTAKALRLEASPAAKTDISTNVASTAVTSEATAAAVMQATPATPARAAVTAAPAAPVAPVAPVIPTKTWTAANGTTLQSTIKLWAKDAGWAVAWNDERPDLEVVGTVSVPGTLVDAVSYLFNVYQRSGAKYDVELYTEQKLVLVKKQ